MPQSNALELTRRWLRDWVIELNLCPFASHPYSQGKVRIVSIAAADDDEAFRFVLEQLDLLYRTPAEDIETTLVVVEKGLESFDYYLDLLQQLEAILPQTGLEGEIQIASFHPEYCFEGEMPEDASNYTNRSPYPMFHLIREASLEKAIAAHPDAEGIPGINMQKLREMGLENVKRRLENILGRDHQ